MPECGSPARGNQEKGSPLSTLTAKNATLAFLFYVALHPTCQMNYNHVLEVYVLKYTQSAPSGCLGCCLRSIILKYHIGETECGFLYLPALESVSSIHK